MDGTSGGAAPPDPDGRGPARGSLRECEAGPEHRPSCCAGGPAAVATGADSPSRRPEPQRHTSAPSLRPGHEPFRRLEPDPVAGAIPAGRRVRGSQPWPASAAHPPPPVLPRDLPAGAGHPPGTRAARSSAPPEAKAEGRRSAPASCAAPGHLVSSPGGHSAAPDAAMAVRHLDPASSRS